jgi:hypothetical protein
MKRTIVAVIILSLTGVCVRKAVKAADTPKERTYLPVVYCLNPQSVADQRKSGKCDVVVGYLLPSLNPDSEEMRKCVKDGSVPMYGYVQVTPPFTSLDGGTPKPD